MNKIFFDLETTGFGHKLDDRIIEIAAIEFDENEQPTGRQFHSLIDPGRSIPDVVVRLTGITDDQVAGKPKFADVVYDFIAFIEGHEVIAHNGNDFDVPFLQSEMNRANVPYTFWEKPAKITDSIVVARQVFPGKKVNLDNILKMLEINNDERMAVGHNALLDCKMLAQAFFSMTKNLSPDTFAAADHETDVPRAPIVRIQASSLPSVVVPEVEVALHERTLDALESAGRPSVARASSSRAGGPRP